MKDNFQDFKSHARNGYDEYSKHKWAIFWKALGVIAFLIVAVVIGKVVLFPIKVATTVIDSAGQVIEKTLDADNVLQNYEWFKQTHRDFLATDLKIRNSQSEFDAFQKSAGQRSDWTFEDKNEYSRLSSTLTGLKNYREDLVAQYNARSKMINRKIFKGKDVPYELQ